MPLDILPSKELTKEEQARALRSTPEWQAYMRDLEGLIQGKRIQGDDCPLDQTQGLQGEIRGIKLALAIITEIK